MLVVDSLLIQRAAGARGAEDVTTVAASAPMTNDATAAPRTRVLMDLPWGLSTRGSSEAGIVE